MTVSIMSSDQILSEAARQIRAVSSDPELQGEDAVVLGLERSMITATSTSHAVEATMSLDLRLSNIHLPDDIAGSVSHCEEVSTAAGEVLTVLHTACASARSKILEAAGRSV